jgi:hypothetical protein
MPQFDNYYNYDNKDKRCVGSLQPGNGTATLHHLTSPLQMTELTNAELRSKLLHMGKSMNNYCE